MQSRRDEETVAPRRQEPAETEAAVRSAHERIGYATCEVDLARQRLTELQERRGELLAQAAACATEVEQLERELRARLAAWRVLDEQAGRVEALGPAIARVEAVRRSFTYRAVDALLRLVNRVRAPFARRRG